MMLAGFETATSGEITLGGKLLNNQPPHKRDIGMVFQNYALFPHMTVAENVRFRCLFVVMAKADIQEKCRKHWPMIKMDSFGHRYPAQLIWRSAATCCVGTCFGV